MNPSLQMPDEGMTLNELSNFVAEQLKRLNLVLKSIDGLNIVDIKFELQGGAFLQFNRKGIVFFDGTKETFKVGVDGRPIMTGALIQAVAGAFPNVKFDGEGNIFQASKSETEYIAIDPDLTGTPTLIFKTAAVEALVSIIGASYSILTTLGHISINAQSGNLLLNCENLTMNGSTGFTGSFATGTNTVIVKNGIITSVV